MYIKLYLKDKFIHVVDKLGLIKPMSDPFILMYHRVIDEHINDNTPIEPGMFVSKNTFQMHIEYLKNHHDILPLKLLLDNYFSGKEMNHCCSITFDDGWGDNYLNAFELLKYHNIQASFFLATSFIGTNSRFWSEDVAFFLHNSDETAITKLFVKCNIPNDIKYIINNKNMLIGDKITEAVRLMKYIDIEVKKEMINRMIEYNNKNLNNEKTMMDWDQVNEMHRSGLCKFYPHSHSHELLSLMNENEISEEISTSLRLIYSNIQNEKNIDIFCYPSGKTNQLVIKNLIKYDFKYALGTNNGNISHSNGCYEISRIRLHDDISNNRHMFKYVLR